MTTLSDALQNAANYWEAKGRSSRMMSIRAQACGDVLGMKQRVELIGAKEATKVLTKLHQTKSKGSVPVYYAAFKRAVAMAGGDTRGWPKAGSAPRKVREPLTEEALDLLAWEVAGYTARYKTTPEAMDKHGYIPVSGPDPDGIYTVRAGNNWQTYDLLELLRGSGLRVEREALSWDALTWDAGRKLLKVKGKGDHERVIPVERPETVALLNSPERMRKMRLLTYSGHLKRWQQAVYNLRHKITSLKPTPHAVRHYYATRAYARSGNNLRAVQELLGHSDISTTARYLGVNPEDLRQAVA